MPPGSVPWCCNGSISIRVEDLNQWQPVPWGTRAHQQLYAKGRNRIENTNGIIKEDGGLRASANSSWRAEIGAPPNLGRCRSGTWPRS